MNGSSLCLGRSMKAWSTWISARSSWKSRATVLKSPSVCRCQVDDRTFMMIEHVCVLPALRELCVYGHEWAPTVLAGLPEWPQRLWTHPQQHQTALAQRYVFISNITSASCDSWGQRSNLIFGKRRWRCYILSRRLRHSVTLSLCHSVHHFAGQKVHLSTEISQHLPKSAETQSCLTTSLLTLWCMICRLLMVFTLKLEQLEGVKGIWPHWQLLL